MSRAAKIIELKASGLTSAQIAEKLGVTRSTVCGVMYRAKQPPKSKRQSQPKTVFRCGHFATPDNTYFSPSTLKGRCHTCKRKQQDAWENAWRENKRRRLNEGASV